MTGRTQEPDRSTLLASAPTLRSTGRRRTAQMSEEERNELEAAIADLWRQFKDTGEPRLRERLILHYSPLVKYVADGSASACRPTSSRPTSSPTASSA